jgi:ferritin-like metal-binding protein YciE
MGVALVDNFNAKGIMKKRSRKTQSSSRSRKTAARRNQNSQSEYESGQQGGMDNELHKLFLEELADIYSAENQLTKALPKMAKAAESEELREAFEEHLQQTEEQISRLDQVFESLGEKMQRKTCKAMQGLIEEGNEVIQEHKGSSAIDAALIAAAQKVEHYEIATYGTLCTWADQMGHQDALDLLKQSIEEEETTDERLTELAESIANERAEQD